MDRRVVITGLGIISSIGIGKDEFWTNLIAGKSGISEIEGLDTTSYPCHNGGEVKNLKIEDYLSTRQADGMGKCSQFAVIASGMAIKDSGIDMNKLNHDKIGVSFGTTDGEVQVIQKIHDKVYIDKDETEIPKLCAQYPCCQANVNVAKTFDLHGDNIMIPNACAAGNFAIGYAYDLIRISKMDYMIAGGADVFSRTAFTGFNRLLAVAREKVRPFDKNRSGMMVGEGAGIVFLESLDSAMARGAHIYAEIGGYGVSCDAYHMTTPHPEAKGVMLAMKKALKSAGITEEDIDYISLHGTGTNANDKAESYAIKKFLKERYKQVPASSIKSMIGHTMGAASAIETITCSLIVQNDIIPPTINYETIDPDCDIDCVPNIRRNHVVNIALNNSYAFGGNNTSLVIKKWALK